MIYRLKKVKKAQIPWGPQADKNAKSLIPGDIYAKSRLSPEEKYKSEITRCS
jgi:hypothetical protein